MGTLKHLWQHLLHKYARVHPNRAVFTSLNGHYSDSPMYIAQAMHKLDSTKEIVWLVKRQYMDRVPKEYVCVDIDSSEAEKYRRTAAVLVDNVYGGRAYSVRNTFVSRLKGKVFSFLYKKKDQKIYTTFHGMPFKKIGRDQVGNDIIDMVCGSIVLMSGSKLLSDVISGVTFGKVPAVMLGTPRSDILFSAKEQRTVLREKIGLPTDKKIVMYAPTFRNDGRDVEGKNVLRSGIQQMQEIDFDRLFATLSEKFGGEWVFVCRFHYHVAGMVDWKGLEEKYPGRIINGNLHDEMNDYLACVDMLITDASSCMYDFAMTGGPCFLFFPDCENYVSRERGLYVDITRLPFPLTLTFEELLAAMKGFSPELYAEGVKALFDQVGLVDDAHSSERVAAYILEHWNK